MKAKFKYEKLAEFTSYFQGMRERTHNGCFAGFISFKNKMERNDELNLYPEYKSDGKIFKASLVRYITRVKP